MDKNIMYVALSGLQKCIRRNLPVQAGKLAEIAHEQDPKWLWKRLFTILLEDCGLDTECLLAFHRRRGSYKDKAFVLEAVGLLCHAKKSREVIAAAKLLQKEWTTTEKKILEREFPVFAELREDWSRYGFSCYDSVHPLPEQFDWIIDFAERTLSLDRENLGNGLPFFYTADRYTQEEEIVSQAEDTPMMGCLPLAAFDRHTRIGLQAMSISWNKRFRAEFAEKEHLYIAVFLHEGILCNNFAVHVPSMWDTAMETRGWERFIAPFREFMRDTLIPDLNKVRMWVVRKQYPELEKVFE